MATPFYESMAPSAQDPIQVLLAKACYHLQVAAEALGGPLMAGFYENMAPSAQDPVQVLTAKLAYWAAQVSGGGGGGGGTFRAGSGEPVGDDPGEPRTAYNNDDTGVIYVQNPDGTWPTLP